LIESINLEYNSLGYCPALIAIQEELEETTRMPLYYVDEDYHPAGPEIQ